MSTTADFKNRLTIKFNNDFYRIVEFQHVKPGKGGAFVRTKLKSITNGRILENTFNAGAKIDIADLETKEYTFLYESGGEYVFMSTTDFNQVSVGKEAISNVLYLKDGQTVSIITNREDNRILCIEFPTLIEMVITETEPGEKGNTVTNASKRAKTETGLEILVPLFINTGDVVKIDTRDGKYVERCKK